jgi:hypothetical protein
LFLMDAARGLRFCCSERCYDSRQSCTTSFLSDVLFVVSSKRTIDSTYDFFCGTVIDIV